MTPKEIIADVSAALAIVGGKLISVSIQIIVNVDTTKFSILVFTILCY